MKNYIKLCATIFLMIIILTGVSNQGWAQEKFPTKPITIIVSWAPGGGMDLNARTIQPLAEKLLGQPIVILNKAGAGGAIGFTEGARANPDGYTITQISGSIISTHYMGSPDVNYRNYEPVILTGFSPGTITVKADAPWKTLKEFIDYAKANPGKIRMSNAGHGSAGHIRTVGIELAAGIKFTHVPYKGSGPGLMAVAGGHVEGSAAGIAETIQLAKGGKLKILAITAAERMSAIPDVPTFKELGMDFENGAWYGYLVPKGTPKDRIKIIHDAFKKSMDFPEYNEYMKNQVIMPRYLGPEDLLKFLEKEDKIWLRIIEAAGLGKSK